jgi:hypothetical protein
MVNIPSNTFLVEFSKKRKFVAAVAKHKKYYCRNLKLGKRNYSARASVSELSGCYVLQRAAVTRLSAEKETRNE